jgi:hypothetical protein
MQHPDLQRGKKSGRFSIGLGEDGIFHCVSDSDGRASFHQLLRIFGWIEYPSSIHFRLDPPSHHLDLNVAKLSPNWFHTDLKCTGGGGLDALRIQFDAHELMLDRTILERVFSKPNLGHEEIYLQTSPRLAVW